MKTLLPSYSQASFKPVWQKKKQYTHISQRVRLLFLPQELLYQVHTHPRWSEPLVHCEASLDTSQAASAIHSNCREIHSISHKDLEFKLFCISLFNPIQILVRIWISNGRRTIFLWALTIQILALCTIERLETKGKYSSLMTKYQRWVCPVNSTKMC